MRARRSSLPVGVRILLPVFALLIVFQNLLVVGASGPTVPVTPPIGPSYGAAVPVPALDAAGLLAVDTGLETLSVGLQGLLKDRFKSHTPSKSLPLLRDGADHAVDQVNTALQQFADLTGDSYQSQDALLAALEGIVGVGNVVVGPDGSIALIYRKTVVDQVPMSDLLFSQEQLLLSSKDSLTLTAALTMGMRFGVTPTGEFFVDNKRDFFRLDLSVNQPVDATGRLGFVDIEAPGATAVLDGAYTVLLKEDWDAVTTLSELKAYGLETLSEAALIGGAGLELPAIALQDALPGVTAASRILWNDINNAAQAGLATSELSDKGLLRFQNVYAGTVVDAFSGVAGLLKDTTRIGLLNTPLPLTQQSMADLASAGQELEKEVGRLQAELRRKDAGGAPIYRNPSAVDLAAVLSNLGLSPVGEGAQITTEDIRFHLKFTKPVYAASDTLPTVGLNLNLGDQDGIDLQLSREVSLALTSTEVSYDFILGVKVKDAYQLGPEVGVDLWDADGDKKDKVDPCGFNSQPCDLSDMVDPDADGDGLLDATEDNNDDGDSVAEYGAKTERMACKSLASFLGTNCETLAGMNGVADEAAFNALPVGTMLRFDPVFNLRSPLTPSYRQFILPGEDMVTLRTSINGDVGGGTYPTVAHLGALDMVLHGGYSLSPTFTLGLSDTQVVANDGKVDMKEAASARKAKDFAAMLLVSPSGPVEAHFTLENPLLAETSPGGAVRHVDVVGNLSALDNAQTSTIFLIQPQRVAQYGSADLTDDQIVVDAADADAFYVGQDLHELLGFQNMTTADMIRVLDYTDAWLESLKQDEVLKQQIPFVEDSVSKVLPWDAEFSKFRQMIRGEEPKDLTSYVRALERALEGMGIEGDVAFQVTDQDVRFSIPFAVSGSKSFPLSLVVPHEDTVRLIRTTDPASKIKVSASFDFPVTAGLRFAATDTPFDQRGFITESSEPKVTVSLDQALSGTRAIFGSVAGTLTGTVAMPQGEYMVNLEDANGDGYVTLAELFSSEGAALTHATGPLTADLIITIDGKEPTPVVVRGNLRALENVRAGTPVYNREITDPAIVRAIDPQSADQIYVDPEVDLAGMLLDMEVMVEGFRDYAQLFVDITSLLDIDLPIIGDALKGAKTAAEGLVSAADFLGGLLHDINEDDQAFLDMVEVELEGFIHDDLGLDFIDVEVSGGIEDQEVLVEFDYTLELVSESIPLGAGLDLGAAFNFDFNATGVLTVVFNAHIGIGVSVEDGFFVQGGRIAGIHARLAAEDISASAELLGFLHMNIDGGEIAVAGPGEADGKPAVFLGAILGDVTDEEPNPRITLIQILESDAPDAEDAQQDTTCSSSGDQAEGCDAPEPPAGGDEGGNPLKVGLELEFTAVLPIISQIAFSIQDTDINFPPMHATLEFAWGYTKLFPEEAGGEEEFPEMEGGDSGMELSMTDLGIDIAGLRDILLPPLETLNTINPMAIDEVRQIVTTEIPMLGFSILDAAHLAAEVSGDPTITAMVAAVDALIILNDIVGQLQDNVPGAPVIVPMGSVDILPDFQYFLPLSSGQSPQEMAENSPLMQETLGDFNDLNQGPADPFIPIKFPFLMDPIQLANLLSGQTDDITFIEIDLGGMPLPAQCAGEIAGTTGILFGACIDIDITIFEVDVIVASGSIHAGFSGCLCLILRPGVGLDSRGLLPGHSFTDGIYIKDYRDPDTNADLAEIQALAFVEAFVRGSIHIGPVSISAHAEGGITLNAGIFINDDTIFQDDADRNDGKLHIDEILALLIGFSRDGAVPAAPTLSQDAVGSFELPDELKNLTADQVQSKYDSTNHQEYIDLASGLSQLDQESLVQIPNEAMEKIAVLMSTTDTARRFKPLKAIVTLPQDSISDMSAAARTKIANVIDAIPDAEFNELLCRFNQDLPSSVIDQITNASRKSAIQSATGCSGGGGGGPTPPPAPTPSGGGSLEDIDLASMLCLMRFEAALTGHLGVGLTATIDLLFFSVDFGFDWSTDFTLFEFTLECDQGTQVGIVRTDDDGQRVLRPAVGQDASKRGDNTGDVSEIVVIRRVGSAICLSVNDSAEQCFPDVDLVELNMGAGNDVVHGNSPLPLPVIATGGPGDDFIEGSNFADTISGGPGNDAITGYGGADLLVGNAGDDIIDAGSGEDTVYGDNDNGTGVGNDILIGGSGGDAIHGGGGNDIIAGEDGDDTLNGNDGNDFIIGDVGLDVITGGDGDDILSGGADNDNISGDRDDDTITGDGGNDILSGGDNDDEIHGNDGNDTINGNAGDDSLYGDDNDDTIYGDSGNDLLLGGLGDDTLNGGAGDDNLSGEDGGDILYGGSGLDVLHGNAGNDTIYGGPDHDELYGDADDDDLFGGSGNDLMYGGTGDDYMEGNEETDTMYGEDGEDDLMGGSSSVGINDSDDLMDGGPGHDFMVGDNASITRPGGSLPGVQPIVRPAGTDPGDGSKLRTVTLYDVATTLFTPAVSAAGSDTIWGFAGNDRIYGGGGNDTIHGGADDDIVQGNDGVDTIYGEAGQDDIAGGTGRTTSDSAASAIDGRKDGNDTIYGGDGVGGVTSGDYDVIAGDNADIQRASTWALNTFYPGKVRTVTLLDTATVSTPAGAGTSGNDSLYGEAQDDVLFGGDGDDTVRGYHIVGTAGAANDGDDFLFGNNGADTLYGDGGQDDVTGGTGRTTGDNDIATTSDDSTAVDGRLDGADLVYGGDGVGGVSTGDYDVIAGDNATIDRLLTGGAWKVNSFGAGRARTVRLLDVATLGSPTLDVGTSAADRLYGEANEDVLYGGGGADQISGDNLRNSVGTITLNMLSVAGDDFLFGNNGADTLYGDGGQDDVTGGTGRTTGDNDIATTSDDSTAVDGRLDGADLVYGGDGVGGVSTGDYDVIAGDNATIDRLLTGGAWKLNSFGAGRARTVRLLDTATLTAPTLDVGTSGADRIYGEANEDVLFGGGGADQVSGDNLRNSAGTITLNMLSVAGDDFLFGNNGADTLYGDGGQDDITGGTGRTTGDNDIATTSDDSTAVNGRLDGADLVYGGDGVGGVSSSDFDVIAGDNATIDRPLTGGLWQTNTFNAGRVRTVTIYDVATLTFNPGVTTSGGDTIYGEANDDVIYAGGGNDTVRGYHLTAITGIANDGPDFIFGNAGNDTLYGDGGQDDLVGGTGRTTSDNNFNTGSDDGSAVDGRLDGNDTIFGGNGIAGIASDDYDAIVGDNVLVDRALTVSGLWIYVQWDQWNRDASDVGLSTQRIIRLLDKPVLYSVPVSGVYGHDTLHGEHGDDVLYGQTGDDSIYGETGQDIIYGDLGNDDIFGGLGDDVIYGQGGIDHIFGDGGKDVVHGGASDLVPSCSSGEKAVPYNDTVEYVATDTRATPETNGRDEGSKGQTPIKRKNPVCLQLVQINITGTLSVSVGGNVQFTATGTYDDGSTGDITGQVVWHSSNTAKATVSATGVVHGVAAGTANIYAQLYGITSNTLIVTVT